MTRMFETREITKLLDVLIGKTEAVGETYEDECRLDNLKTLIDVTNWCLDGLQFAMESGYGRAEYSMAEISYTAQCALDEYGRWIADVLGEQMADRKTEPTISKMEQVATDTNVGHKDEPKTQMKTQNSNLAFEKRTMRDCYNCKRYETEGECIECHYEPKDEPRTEDEMLREQCRAFMGIVEQTERSE